MGDKTEIAWTDATWNPVTGCTPVSEACKNCYAAQYARRGIGDFKDRNFSEIHCQPKRLEIPLKWRKPRRIFLCSMGDLFHDAVPNEFIDRVFAVMLLAEQHTFQILTKRPQRLLDYFKNPGDRRDAISEAIIDSRLTPRHKLFKGLPSPAGVAEGVYKGWRSIMPSHVWLGVTAENQAVADERIPLLLQTPAAVRFVSVEPMLGEIDIRQYLLGYRKEWDWDSGGNIFTTKHPAKLDWCICGGESGPKARPIHPDWARSLRDQCRAAGVPFFFKSWGEWLPDDQCQNEQFYVKAGHPGAPKWAIDKPVCHLSPGLHAFKVGPSRAGHLLDGQEHREFPLCA